MSAIRILSFWTSISLFMLISCCKASDSQQEKSLINSKKILIVYLSRTQNTKAVAEIIHHKVKGDLIALELVNTYPVDYKAMVNQVSNENLTGYLPPLKTKINHIEKYDVIFIGFPTWGMQLPPPMKSFLSKYDLSGRKVIPFNSNAGYGIGNSFETVKILCPNSEVLDGFSTKGGVERDGMLYVMEGDKEKQVQLEIHNWLIQLGLIK